MADKAGKDLSQGDQSACDSEEVPVEGEPVGSASETRETYRQKAQELAAR